LGTYAGINTLAKVRSNDFEDDDSNIVIWAGAHSSSDIASARF
jgi:hypothetical protein